MLGKYIKKIELKKGEHKLYLRKSQDIDNVLFFLKYNIHSQFKLLMDVCGIDNMKKLRNRFEINYNLLSVRY
jgi:NADH:ubiquinone oxidoreductase subunit C